MPKTAIRVGPCCHRVTHASRVARRWPRPHPRSLHPTTISILHSPRLSTQTGSSSTPVSSSLRDCPFPSPRTPARLPIDRPAPPSPHPPPPRNVLGRDPDARRRVCRLVPAQKVQARLPRRAERGQDLPHHPFREFVLTLLSRLRLLLREHEPTSACAACPDPKPRLFAVERMPRRTRCRQLLAHWA